MPSIQESPPIIPTKKHFRLLKRLCLSFAVLFIILVAGSWALLNFWFAPRIDQYRPYFEELAYKQLGSRVEIGKITATRQGILPAITLSDVAFFDAQGRTALTVDEINAQISSQALLGFKLQFSTFVLEKPQLHIQRLENNHILIAGIDITELINQQKKLSPKKNKPQQLPNSVLWLSQQHHLQINQGQVRWSDNTINAPDIVVTAFDLDVRKNNRDHTLLLEATPPESWGKRFTLTAHLVEPTTSSQANYMDWSGDVQILFPEANIEQLHQYIILPIDINKGKGFLEVKAQYDKGEITQTVANLNLSEVEVKPSEDAPSIRLMDLKGEITGSWIQQIFHLHTDNLSLRLAKQSLPNGRTIQEQSWQTGILDLSWEFDDDFKLKAGKLKTGSIDLAFLASFAHRLPLPEEVKKQLIEARPQGQIDFIDLEWNGPVNELKTYRINGRLSNLAATAAAIEPPEKDKKMKITRPGGENLGLEFSITEKAGDVTVTVENGHITVPGLFPDPTIPVTFFTAKGGWTFNDKKQTVIHVPSIELINDSAVIHAQATWTSPDPSLAEDTAGYLELTSTLDKLQLKDISKYLPNTIMPKVRHYLSGALLSGTADQVELTIKGPLADFPYHYKDTGIFLIEGDAKDVVFNYVPDAVRPPEQRPWPYLEQVSGRIRITGKGLRLDDMKGRAQGLPGIQLNPKALYIDDWSKKDTHVIVRAELAGSINQFLSFINHSGLGNIMQDQLSQASGTGDAKAQFTLDLHVENMPQSEVTGQVQFDNNTMTLWPFVPELKNVKGTLHFSEKGFNIPAINATALGGPLTGRVQWDMSKGFDANLQGTLTDAGIRNDANFKAWVPTEGTQWLNGQTPYTVTAKTQNKQLTLQIQSDLEGLAFNLPAPLQKNAQTTYPLTIKMAPLNAGNQFLPMRVEIQAITQTTNNPDIHSTMIVHPQGKSVVIKQAAIGLNAAPALPAEGFIAQARLQRLDVPGWMAFFKSLPRHSSLPEGYTDASQLTLPSEWPEITNAYIEDLQITDTVQLPQVQINLKTENQNWNAQISSPQAEGEVNWQHTTFEHPKGLLSADLKRLWLPELQFEEIKKRTNQQQAQTQEYVLLPDAQLSIQDMRFGKVELENIFLQAHMKSQQTPMRWEINDLTFNIGESRVKASGFWTKNKTLLTQLNARLESKDTGKMLTKLNLPQTIAHAPGVLEGTLSWRAAPYLFDRQTLRGDLKLHLQKGQVLFTDPGAGRLLSVLSLQSLPNRMSMDFRDVFDKGLAFDQVDGSLTLQDGMLIVNTLKLKGINANVNMNGHLNLLNKTQKLKVIVEPEINAGTASLAITAFNPALGIGSLAAQMVLREPIRKALTRTYHVTGSWEKAEVLSSTSEPVSLDDENTVYKTKNRKTEQTSESLK